MSMSDITEDGKNHLSLLKKGNFHLILVANPRKRTAIFISTFFNPLHLTGKILFKGQSVQKRTTRLIKNKR